MFNKNICFIQGSCPLSGGFPEYDKLQVKGYKKTPLDPSDILHSLPVRGCLHALQVRLDPEVGDHLAVLLPEGPDGLPPAVVVEDELVGGVEHGQHVEDPLGHLGDESLADLARPEVDHLHAAGGGGEEAVAAVLGGGPVPAVDTPDVFLLDDVYLVTLGGRRDTSTLALSHMDITHHH